MATIQKIIALVLIINVSIIINAQVSETKPFIYQNNTLTSYDFIKIKLDEYMIQAHEQAISEPRSTFGSVMVLLISGCAAALTTVIVEEIFTTKISQFNTTIRDIPNLIKKLTKKITNSQRRYVGNDGLHVKNIHTIHDYGSVNTSTTSFGNISIDFAGTLIFLISSFIYSKLLYYLLSKRSIHVAHDALTEFIKHWPIYRPHTPPKLVRLFEQLYRSYVLNHQQLPMTEQEANNFINTVLNICLTHS
jgi:hypothetical protein